MTEATNLTFPARRTGDFRLVAGVSGAHFVSHFYMLVLPPLIAFVRADYAVSYTEVGLALTMINGWRWSPGLFSALPASRSQPSSIRTGC